jgi:hypothetical protein
VVEDVNENLERTLRNDPASLGEGSRPARGRRTGCKPYQPESGRRRRIMGYEFMSDEWFAKVQDLTEEVNPEVPAGVAELKMNIAVNADDGEKAFSVVGGRMKKGHVENASVTIALPIDLAEKIFLGRDNSAGVRAFMSGQMKIQGDVSTLMAPESVKPTESQEVLTQKVREIAG